MKTVEELNKQFTPFLPEGSESIILRDIQLDPNKIYIRNNKYIDWILNYSDNWLRNYR